MALRYLLYMFDNFSRDTQALNHLHAGRYWVRLNRLAVM
jgi:hypothetical protein